ncbi:hypothetical protein NDU88_009374 [Pleurodeles waltl]|uniref:Uncharacterized protein n=1 Tax=Pleurodeles waltl TaxID=8319 RepID=A0AAV7NZF0_PLEWA|nr:hypothetical protein NDU88_009374 [Pleurodeles waltl]
MTDRWVHDVDPDNTPKFPDQAVRFAILMSNALEKELCPVADVPEQRVNLDPVGHSLYCHLFPMLFY